MHKVLESKNISPSKVFASITAGEIIDSLQEALDDFEIKFDFGKLTKQELVKLFYDYVECVSLYHPENYHQERGALLKNTDVLKKYGMSQDDTNMLDFT